MKNKTKQHHFRLVLTIILLAIATCGSAQRVIVPEMPATVEKTNDARYGASSDDSSCIPPRDYDIIKGNYEKYREYRVYWMYEEYDEQKSCNMQRERLIYAFIMAEIYRDTIAALDFTQQIGFMGVVVDSVLGAKVIEFLEMASKSKPDIISLTAARELARVYKDGLYGTPQDIKKSHYYRQLSDSIVSSIRTKQNRNTN